MNFWKESRTLPDSPPPPRILFIQYYFPPMGGGGVQRIVKFLKFWDYRRFQASVLTVKHSFFYSEDRQLQSEVPDQAVVIRSGSADPFRLMYLLRKFIGRKSGNPANQTNESGSIGRRISAAIFIPDSRIGWFPFAVFRILRMNRSQPVSLIIASMPPFTTGIIGAAASRLLGIPLILDYRDAWHRNPYLPPKSRLKRKIHLFLEQQCIKRASALLFVNPALAKQYLADFPTIESKPHMVIRNGYDEDDFLKIGPDPGPKSGPFRIGLIGSVYSQGNHPRSLLDALAICHSEDPCFIDTFECHFVGKRTQEFENSISDSKVSSMITFHSYLPHLEALEKAREFDALCLIVEDHLEGSDALTPGRIYEHLALRRPILAICPPESDVASVVRGCEAGEVIAYSDSKTIANILMRWQRNKKNFANNYRFTGIEVFSREKQCQQLLKFVTNKISAT